MVLGETRILQGSSSETGMIDQRSSELRRNDITIEGHDEFSTFPLELEFKDARCRLAHDWDKSMRKPVPRISYPGRGEGTQGPATETSVTGNTPSGGRNSPSFICLTYLYVLRSNLATQTSEADAPCRTVGEQDHRESSVSTPSCEIHHTPSRAKPRDAKPD